MTARAAEPIDWDWLEGEKEEKMEKQTLEALQGSIRKWDRIVSGEGIDRGIHNCPLCHLFHTMGTEGTSCPGCPVQKFTGLPGCRKTPYEQYCRSYSQNAARKERDFLISLLPTGVGPVLTEEKKNDD